MNKLSGYTEFTLLSGKHIEFKVCNATYSLYAKMVGLKTYDEVTASLQVPTKEVPDGKGGVKRVQDVTFEYSDRLRQFVFCAAQYACIAQNKPVDFNEWEVGEWLEEIGEDAIFGSIEQPPAREVETAKKKSKKPIIRATQ